MNAATITIKRREFHSDFPVSEKFSRNVANFTALHMINSSLPPISYSTRASDM